MQTDQLSTLESARPLTQSAYTQSAQESTTSPCSSTSANQAIAATPQFLTLDDICACIRRSTSWAYANHIVPIFNHDGKRIDIKRSPPAPWKKLPLPRVDGHARLWLAEDIAAWMLGITSHPQSDDKAVVGVKS